MNKKVFGYIIATLLIGTLVVIMVKTNLEKTEPIPTEQLGTSQPDTDTTKGLGKGDTPPDFELTTVAGDQVKLSDLKGKKIILNFWASWCGPCKAEMPHMEQFYKNNKNENVEVIAVNMTTTEKMGVDAVKDFIKAYGLTFPIPLDQDGAVMDAYKIIPIPTTYLLNTDGTIGQQIIGPMDEKIMKQVVDTLH